MADGKFVDLCQHQHEASAENTDNFAVSRVASDHLCTHLCFVLSYLVFSRTFCYGGLDSCWEPGSLRELALFSTWVVDPMISDDGTGEESRNALRETVLYASEAKQSGAKTIHPTGAQNMKLCQHQLPY